MTKKNLKQFHLEKATEKFDKLIAMFSQLMAVFQMIKYKGMSGPSSIGGGMMVVTGSEMKPCLKLYFPRFSRDDPTSWLYQAKQYFEFQKVVIEYQVSLASVHIDGLALQWHR